MSDYKERVIDDKNKLEFKVVALVDFIKTNFFEKLADKDRELLFEQLKCMDAYLLVLRKRISRFESGM